MLTKSQFEREYPDNPGELTGIDPDHQARYNMVVETAKDSDVLDYGCGVGYGSYILSLSAKTVKGYDIAADAIEWAKHYEQKANNLSYTTEKPTEAVDVVACFECIEHVPDADATLAEISKLFRKHLFISSPVPHGLGGMWSPHHVREFTKPEFLALLEKYFDIVEVFDQHTNGCHVVIAHCVHKQEA